MREITRRQFVERCASATVGAWLLPTLASGRSVDGPSVKFPENPRERVAVAAYPFREYIVGWMGWDGQTPSPVPAAQQIELKDFAAHVAEKFNVHRIEPWSPLFPSTDPKYIEQFRAAVEKSRSGVANIAVDGHESQYSRDAAVRAKAVATSKEWIDVAAALGSPSVRTHIEGTEGVKPDVALAADTLSRVAEYAAKKNVVVHLENDDPVSEDPFFLVQLIEKVNSSWVRALPDLGNSLAAHDEDFSNRAMDEMFAHAYGVCHVKDGESNAQGKFVAVDLAHSFEILKKHGYKGFCSMEYDAAGDPYKATEGLVQQTVKFLS